MFINRKTITMEEGKQFVIEAKDNSKDNVYVDSRSLNGQPLTRNYITYGELTSGGTLQLQMSAQPNKQLGTTKADVPYSYSTIRTSSKRSPQVSLARFIRFHTVCFWASIT